MVALSNSRDPLVVEALTIYQRLRPSLEPKHNGEFVVINLDSGEFELDRQDLLASQRARLRFGPSARLMTLRVGQIVAYRLGASSLGQGPC